MIDNFLAHLKDEGYDFSQELVILEVGSPDCDPSLEFHKAFPRARIFALECNPTTVPVCQANIDAAKASDRITLVPKATADSLETVLQAHQISKVDLVWMDLQADDELLALQSMGSALDKVDFVHTTQVLHDYLLKRNFQPVITPIQEEIIYKNTRIFDVVIPLGPNDQQHIVEHLAFTQANVVGCRRIFIVTRAKNLNLPGCTVIDETIFPFSFDRVTTYIGKTRAGWYFQQLLKLYAGLVIPDILPRYLVIDADTFFLQPTTFYDRMIPCYSLGMENHPPYFAHLQRLHPNFRKGFKYFSAIVHHMVFEVPHVRALMQWVEDHHNSGLPFYDIFLQQVNERSEVSGASEYELYLQYMVHFQRDRIRIRWLRWRNVNDQQFQTLKTNPGQLNYVSWHWYTRERSTLSQALTVKDKVTVTLWGRLGNNLFEIAAAYAYALEHQKELVLDVKHKSEFPADLGLKLLWVDLSQVPSWVDFHEVEGHYTPVPHLAGNVRLQGYFQSAKYFRQYRNEVLDLLYDTAALSDSLPPPLEFVDPLPIVCIHIRRTDYVHNVQFDVLPADYYQKGIECARRNLGPCQFLVFSDDIPYARMHLSPDLTNSPTQFVDFGSDVEQHVWMSLQRYHIISNSSFAWWAAFRRSVWVFTPNLWFPRTYGEVWDDLIRADAFPADTRVINYPGVSH